DWGGIDDQAAKRLLAEPDGPATLERVAAVLGVKVADVTVSSLTPATKLVVAGGAALIAVAKGFAQDPALSWIDQVVAVADQAAPRQFAGLAAVLVNARGRTVIVRPSTDAASALRAAGFAHMRAGIRRC